MTTNELINYYAKLLIIQYSGKPKAFATIQASVTPIIMDMLPLAVQDAFTIGTAVGVQLDVLGKYVGVTRSGYGFEGPITLDDSDFTQLILMAITRNTSGSSLAEIQQNLYMNFAGQIQVFDYENMTMDYFVNTTVGSQDLTQLFITEGLLPKPMGVQLKAIIYAPFSVAFFGMQRYPFTVPNVSPFNSYTLYNFTYPWLSYSNAVVA